MKVFSILDVNKSILDLDVLKCELKSVYTARYSQSEEQSDLVFNSMNEDLNEIVLEVLICF